MVAPDSHLQFFVRQVSDGQSIVVQAHAEETVEFLLHRLETMTGIPMTELRLIYEGKQLQLHQSLADCSIQKDAALHLVCRMRSTRYPRACQITSDIVACASRLSLTVGISSADAQDDISSLIKEFFKLIPAESTDGSEFFRIFISCSGPAALVRLYASVPVAMKQCGNECIRCFLSSCSTFQKDHCQILCLPVIFEFCKLLRQVVCNEDPLYRYCRRFLGLAFGQPKFTGLFDWYVIKDMISISEIFSFFKELACGLSINLELMGFSPSLGSLEEVIKEFSSFVNPLICSIKAEIAHKRPSDLPTHLAIFEISSISEETLQLHTLYSVLMERMDKCLGKLEECLHCKATDESEPDFSHWSHHLILLRDLHRISLLYENAESEFWEIMNSRKDAVGALIVRYANRNDDYQWILQHKDVTNFQSRRHLAMLMFPEVKQDFEEQLEMLIDRSNLLSDSFEYITGANPDALHGGIFVEFKNEEATGPGVLREWFFAVIQAMFDERSTLFVACPNDRRRFYPCPATTVDPMHLKYFTFAGRVIALAMMHKIQLGVVFDRVFFLQLAGKSITLDDIRDTDPLLYNSCKRILEMDSDLVDSDVLGLTFEREYDELGLIKTVELCFDGRNKVVNSENREEYINLLIHHHFVASISQQLSHFAQGFSDILSISGPHTLFFGTLDHEDLDRILHGNGSDVSLEDWQQHTDYFGYTVSDPQISWFWQIVGNMSPEQKHSLLFFWTSIKYLPFDGFCGLPSRLHIHQIAEASKRLPSSHTCFFELCLPRYSSMALMSDSLNLITQEYISNSFGTV